MYTRYIGRIVYGRTARLTATVMVVLTLVFGCGKAEPSATLRQAQDEAATQTPIPPTPQAEAQEGAGTPVPPTSTSPPTPEEAATASTLEPTSTATSTPTEPAPTARPTVEEVSFQSGHFQLVGDLQVPAAEGKRPAIIMVHGDGGINRTDSGKYRPIMERFLRAGYAVFSWDKPGTGESTGEFIDGAWIITDRASILVDAVEFLKEHPAIDPERIGVWGISQAGAVMPMALTMSDDIAFMIVVSGPGVNAIDQTAYLIGQQILCQGHSEEEARLAEQSYARLCMATTYQEYLESMETLIQFPYAVNFTGRNITPEEDWSPWDRQVDAFFNPIEVIEQTTIPVLAFFGEKDTQVDPFQGAQAYEEALQKAGNQNFHVELIPGVAHVLALAETGCMDETRTRVYAPEYLDLMEGWLVQLAAGIEPGENGLYLGQTPPGSDVQVFAPGIVSIEEGKEYKIAFSPDLTEIFFTRRTPNARNDRLWYSRFENGKLSTPELAPFAYDSLESDACFTPDGKRLYFNSMRPLPAEDTLSTRHNVWFVDKTEGGWSEPQLYESPINDYRPVYFSIADDGTMYFTCSSPRAICYAELQDGQYLEVKSLPQEINFLTDVAHPAIAPDESYIIVDSYYFQGGRLVGSLYISFRKADGSWTQAVRMREALKASESDVYASPRITPDGKYLFFESYIRETDQADIYWVSTDVIQALRSEALK